MGYATATVGADVLHALRSGSGSFAIRGDSLTEAEQRAVDVSWREHSAAVIRSARSYFGRRLHPAQVHDAADWLTSEVYTYAIAQAVAGVAPIPESRRDWAQIAKLLRRRYWRERPDSRGEGRDPEAMESLATWDAFGATLSAAATTMTHSGLVDLMVRWAIAGSVSGRLSDSARKLTVGLSSLGFDCTDRELAELVGMSIPATERARHRLVAKMRAGWLVDVISF